MGDLFWYRNMFKKNLKKSEPVLDRIEVIQEVEIDDKKLEEYKKMVAKELDQLLETQDSKVFENINKRVERIKDKVHSDVEEYSKMKKRSGYRYLQLLEHIKDESFKNMMWLNNANDAFKDEESEKSNKETLEKVWEDIDSTYDDLEENPIYVYVQEFDEFFDVNFKWKKKINPDTHKEISDYIIKGLNKYKIPTIKRIHVFLDHQTKELKDKKIKNDDNLLWYIDFLNNLHEKFSKFYEDNKIVKLEERLLDLSNEIKKKNELIDNIANKIHPMTKNLNAFIIQTHDKIRNEINSNKASWKIEKSIDYVWEKLEETQNKVLEFDQEIEKIKSYNSHDKYKTREYYDKVSKQIRKMKDLFSFREEEFAVSPFSFLLNNTENFNKLSNINHQILNIFVPFDEIEIKRKKIEIKDIEKELKKARKA